VTRAVAPDTPSTYGTAIIKPGVISTQLLLHTRGVADEEPPHAAPAWPVILCLNLHYGAALGARRALTGEAVSVTGAGT